MAGALEFTEATPAASAARLDEGVVHLWRIPYTSSQRRGPLLTVLSAYLGIPASAVALDQGARGKPQLADAGIGRTGGQHQLEFNWSHSGDFALIAITRTAPLGVDIERLGKHLRVTEIAQRFFDPAEARVLADMDPQFRAQAFTGLWCAKEAVLKAAGEGLAFGLARLAFQPGAGGAWTLVRTDPALGDPGDWQLLGLDPLPGYRGALAWRGGPHQVVALCLPGSGIA